MTSDARSDFEAALRTEPRTALIACDFDGTLAPIVADPAEARAYPGAVDALVSLAEHGCPVRVITGRPATRAVQFGELDRVPGIVVAGMYGAQRWSGGAVTSDPAAPGIDHARRLLDLVLAGAAVGVRLEDKGLSVAVHTRQAADPKGELDRLRPAVEGIATATGLQVEPGRFVLELRPGGVDKGTALSAAADEVGARAVLFAGDDLGDLAAFAAVQRMVKRGVIGLTVAAGSAEVPEIEAAADLTVPGPAGVTQLLAELARLLD